VSNPDGSQRAICMVMTLPHPSKPTPSKRIYRYTLTQLLAWKPEEG
jgi:hypothetical protein